MLELRELHSGCQAEWDGIVLSSPRGLLFHLTDWLTIVSETQSLRLLQLGIFEGADLVGVFPLFLKRFGFLSVAGSPFVVEGTHYLGPVIADKDVTEVMRLFAAYMKVHRINYARIIFHHDYPRKPFEAQGYECRDNFSHVVDLTKDQETLWKELKPRCRNTIRKAERAGVVTEIVRDDRYLNDYYRLVEDLYSSQRRTPPSSEKYFRAIWQRFGSKGDLMWVFAKHEETLAAGALLAIWKGWVYYLDGASDKKKNSFGASNAVLWAAIRWAKSEGYSFYDFVGSNVPRLAFFKESFGGDRVTYLTLERSRPSWVKALRDRYALYKGMLYRMKLLGQEVRNGTFWRKTLEDGRGRS